MDPNANWEEQLQLAKEISQTEECNEIDCSDSSHLDLEINARRFAELVPALDEWIEKGGALPESWGLQPVSTERLNILRTAESVCSQIHELLWLRTERLNLDVLSEIKAVMQSNGFGPKQCSHEVDHDRYAPDHVGDGVYDVRCSKCQAAGSFKFEGSTAEILWEKR